MRKHKIHEMLSLETKMRLTPHVTSILILMKSVKSVEEPRRLVVRYYGVDQPNLFHCWNIEQLAELFAVFAVSNSELTAS